MLLLCSVVLSGPHLHMGGRPSRRGGGLEEATLAKGQKAGDVLALAAVEEAAALPGGPFAVEAAPALQRPGAVGRLMSISLAVGPSPGTLLIDQLG